MPADGALNTITGLVSFVNVLKDLGMPKLEVPIKIEETEIGS